MEFGYSPADLYAGYVVDDSDLEFSDCSEEESSGDEGGHPNHSNTVCLRKDQDSGSEDEFDQEMDKELMSKIQLMVSPNVAQATNVTPKMNETEDKMETSATASGVSSTSESQKPDQPSQETRKEYYDDVYFDSSGSSDDEEGESSSRPTDESAGNVGKKVCKLSNDELFYDPKMDDEDEKWVNRQRMAYHNVEVSRSLERQKKTKWKKSLTENSSSQEESSVSEETDSSKGKEPSRTDARLPRSDAVLNCPACMSTLCLDCQRHDNYVNQYRAMFVLNCLVVREETLKYKPKPDKKTRKRRRRGKACVEDEYEEPGSYHPVRCRECNTEVAVYDQDEVFHFFNVLASAPT